MFTILSSLEYKANALKMKLYDPHWTYLIYKVCVCVYIYIKVNAMRLSVSYFDACS